MIQPNKSVIRKIALQNRDFEPIERKIKSLFIQERTIELVLNKKINNFLSYINFQTEVETDFLNNFFLNRKINMSIPRVEHENINFYLISSLKEDIEKGKFGISEPKRELPKADYSNVELAIIPGVAFDEHGGRIGYGKGFYDRFLSEYPHILRIGLAFECQFVENIPVEQHDQKMHFIITENKIIVCNKKIINI